MIDAALQLSVQDGRRCFDLDELARGAVRQEIAPPGEPAPRIQEPLLRRLLALPGDG